MNLLQTTTGSQCRAIKRGVTWASLGSLKTSHAAAFIFQDCFVESVVEVLLHVMEVQPRNDKVVQHALLGRA